MKKMIISFFILALSSGAFNVNAYGFSSKDDPILTGEIARSDLQKQPYAKWFTKNYNNYEADPKLAQELKNISQDIKITIIMGTWCSDSQREVPRTFKIFDAADIGDQRVTIITVNKSAKRDPELIKKYNITNVPLIIFSKENKELGRIIESPNETLEKDMVKILTSDTKSTE